MISREHIATPGDVLTLQLEDAGQFAGSAFVNWRRIEVGERPILALSFNK